MLGLCVRVIGDIPVSFSLNDVMGHSIQDETMESVTGPGISRSQGFQNNQGFFELLSPCHGPLEAEIPKDSSICNHPVKDKIPMRIEGFFIKLFNANGWYFVHQDLLLATTKKQESQSKDRLPTSL